MKWGDTQNLLSVIIGLNIAFYVYKEIRLPRLMKVKDDAATLKKAALICSQTHSQLPLI
jgi:hypothetical protein